MLGKAWSLAVWRDRAECVLAWERGVLHKCLCFLWIKRAVPISGRLLLIGGSLIP